MSSRNRRGFFDDEEDGDEQFDGWSRNRRSNGTIARDRRNGVSRDPLSEVREMVEDHWRETLSENFHPITLALDMLDTSSLGRAKELDDFKKVNLQIEQALQSTVNEHFQGFNSSVGTYGQTTSSISASQKKVRVTRDALLRAKVQLSSKRADLLEMSDKSTQYQNMINVLRQVAELKRVPEVLEAQLSTKHFLQAVETLSNAISTANRDEMQKIAALGDIRQYLKAQAVGLVEILVEELHNHLYLRSPYCDGRWAAYTTGQVDLPVVHHEEGRPQTDKKVQVYSSLGRLEIESHQYRQLSGDVSLDVTENRHPESSSLSYIVILAQALYSMGKLPYALEVMTQRVPVEVHQIVARTMAEVKARHQGTTLDHMGSDHSLDLDALEEHTEPLKDLLWTLFSKWDAILQAHRALYDAVGYLQDQKYGRKDSSNSSTVAYDFGEIWRSFELEMKTILKVYLTEKERHTFQEEEEKGAWNELFVDRTTRKNRGGLFSIEHASSNKEKPFAVEEKELREMLQGSVPGLLSENNEGTWRSATTTTDTSATQTLLARASPFNITAILQSTIAFLNRAKRIVPNSTSVSPNSLAGFLDEFLETVFYPQLSESVDALYRDAVDESASAMNGGLLSEDYRRIQECTLNLLTLIDRLSSLLSKIRYSREMYAQTILTLMANYYHKSVSWLTSMTANDTPNSHLGALKLGPAWANSQNLRDLWLNYDIASATELALYEAVSAEFGMIMEIKKDFVIQAEDLIRDSAKIEGLVRLYQSIATVEKSLEKMQTASRSNAANTLQYSEEAHNALEKLSRSYSSLGKSILIILRMEIRVHALYYLQVALGQGNYNIEEKANEVDGTFADLNSDLQSICTPLNALQEQNYRFLVSGLAMLMSGTLLEDASSISIMTKHGAQKLGLGISALQQNLRNLVLDPTEADLSRAAMFYSLFDLGPQGLVEQAVAASLDFTPEQAARMMTLMYSVDLASESSKAGNRDSLSGKRKQLNEHLSLLSTQMLAES